MCKSITKVLLSKHSANCSPMCAPQSLVVHTCCMWSYFAEWSCTAVARLEMFHFQCSMYNKHLDLSCAQFCVQHNFCPSLSVCSVQGPLFWETNFLCQPHSIWHSFCRCQYQISLCTAICQPSDLWGADCIALKPCFVPHLIPCPSHHLCICVFAFSPVHAHCPVFG